MTEKILIVDDETETVNFLKLLLTRQGYQALTAYNGMQALSLAHSEHPDLIILDVMMPGQDGFEVARNLRGHPETATVPILMFTAKAQMEDKMTGYEAGVDIYLTKPVHPIELQANIKALLSQRRTRAETLAAQGYMIGVIGAKGGLGVSTVALNLAMVYHNKNKTNIIAAEMRPGQGTWAQELHLPEARALNNLLRMDPTQITAAAVEEALTHTTFDIRLLLASTLLDGNDVFTATEQYTALLRQLSLISPLVMLDLGTNYLPAYESVSKQCQEMIVVTDSMPITVKRTHLLMEDLRKKGFGSSKALTLVIVNRTRGDMQLSMSQIEETLSHNIALGFPPAGEQAYTAAIRQVPLYTVQPEGILSKQFEKLSELTALHVPK